jgi:hypothetical protein
MHSKACKWSISLGKYWEGLLAMALAPNSSIRDFKLCLFITRRGIFSRYLSSPQLPGKASCLLSPLLLEPGCCYLMKYVNPIVSIHPPQACLRSSSRRCRRQHC